MKVLVTGGAGFIGSHLCDVLGDMGHHVTILDNLSTGQNKSKHLFQNLIRGDVTADIPDQKFDWIFNLACPASPVWYQKDPVATSLTNIGGMYCVLENVKKHGGRVLQASTSEVYGDPQISPQHEDYWGNVNPIGTRACYDEGKRMAECLCYDYMRQFGVDVRVARIFNTYGPRMLVNDGRVVSNFIVQALQHKPITIYGDGSQTRSLCYVDDTVQGLIALMQSDETRPVNIGRDKEITIMELANMIVDMTKSKSEFVYRPLPQDDPKQRRPDLKRARDIGWEPHTKTDDGLIKTIEYFKGVL